MASHDVEILLHRLVSLSSKGLQQIDIEEKFQVLKELGDGGYGSVVLAKDHKTDQLIALKIMKKGSTSERKFLLEFSMSFLLSSHPNIIGSFGIAFETQDQFVFAQEVAPVGDLFSLITPYVGFPEDKVKRCAMQISSALEFIADKGLVHMDVKPENILVFDQECYCIKVTDFGLTRVEGTIIRYRSGSASFMAPEMCELNGEVDLAVDSTLDVWSFGVLLYCLITGAFPWKSAMVKDKTFSKFVAWQNNINCDDPPGSWNKLPTSVQRMLRGLLAIERNQRSKSTEVLLYMEESWRMDSKDEDDIYMDSSRRLKESRSTYTSCSSNHHEGKKSLITPMSCRFTTENSGAQSLQSQWQDCSLLLVDDQISMFVGAEVELT